MDCLAPSRRRLASLGGEEKLLFLLIALGIGVRVWNLFTAAAIDMDGTEFAGVAKTLLKGSVREALDNARLPVYPALMASFSFLIPDIELSGRLVSFVFGVLLLFFCFRFAKGLWGRERALWVSALVSLHPYLAQYSSRVLAESVATFLFTASLFLFYNGWVGAKNRHLALAGLLLAFAYLTKPEYLLYFMPLSLILLCFGKDRSLPGRLRLLSFFLSVSLLIVLAFLLYLRIRTGYWVPDRRVIAWSSQGCMGIFTYFLQEMTTPGVLYRLPIVLFNFFRAIYPPFLVLAILGFLRINGAFAILAVAVVLFHVVGRSFPTYSTARYSIEFVPLVLTFSAFGIQRIKDAAANFGQGRQLAFALLISASVILLYMGIRFPGYSREMHKQAGLILQQKGKAERVASRLPITAFYAESAWTNLEGVLGRVRTCEDFATEMESKGVDYVVIDEKIGRRDMIIQSCVAEYRLISDLRKANRHVAIYQVVPR